MIPKPEERKRYSKRTLSMESLQIYNKRPRLEPHIDFNNDSNDSDSPTLEDLNEQAIQKNFSLEKAVQLIFSSINNLPATMPVEFAREYNKYVEAGTVGQTNLLVKLLTSQIIEAGISTSIKNTIKKNEEQKLEDMDVEEEKDEPKEKV